ncbi:hypothetical protein PR001_g29860, partial [Phytophthora rubi]
MNMFKLLNSSEDFSLDHFQFSHGPETPPTDLLDTLDPPPQSITTTTMTKLNTILSSSAAAVLALTSLNSAKPPSPPTIHAARFLGRLDA